MLSHCVLLLKTNMKQAFTLLFNDRFPFCLSLPLDTCVIV